jgi:hypothetical protein
MKKMILLMVFLLSIYGVSAIQTYVGIDVLELKDSACNNDMKIVSNPGGGYPLHFKVTRNSDSVILWEGDSTEDIDYATGDVILLPEPVDLTSGEVYDLDMDVDMVGINRVALNGFVYYSSSSCGPFIQMGRSGSGGRYQYVDEICTGITYRNNMGINGNKVNLNYCDRSGVKVTHELSSGNFDSSGSLTSVYSGSFGELIQPDVGLFQFQFIYE